MTVSAAPDYLIDRIHEAGLVPSLWPVVLGELGAAIGGSGGFIFGVRDGYVSAITSAEHIQAVDAFMNDGWSERDLALKRGIALNYSGFVNDGDILSDEEIATDDVYCNFYRKHGIGYRAGTIIPIPNGDSVAFVLPRHQDNGPVPRQIVTFLDSLRPHIARSALTANRLGFERARAQADALQALGLPGAVLHGRGRVLAANSLFEALMPSLFQDRARRVTITNAAADALLAIALDTLPSGDMRSVKSIPIAAAHARLPMVLHLVPIRRAAHDLFARATSLLVVTPINRGAVPTADVLQGLFDLTPAEARIARAIGQAQSIEDLALTTSVSRETVRSQFKSVLQKTGVSRQQDLIALLAGKALPPAE